MAGKKIFLGKMIEALQNDITTVVSTLNQHSAELNKINHTVSQGINTVNVRPGSTNVITFVHGEINLNGSSTSWSYEEKSGILLRSMADGAVTINCNIKASGIYGSQAKIGIGTDPTNIFASTTIGGSFGNYVPVSFNVPVKSGTLLKLYAWTGKEIGFYMQANSFNIRYDLVDIVNEGAFVNS